MHLSAIAGGVARSFDVGGLLIGIPESTGIGEHSPLALGGSRMLKTSLNDEKEKVLREALVCGLKQTSTDAQIRDLTNAVTTGDQVEYLIAPFVHGDHEAQKSGQDVSAGLRQAAASS